MREILFFSWSSPPDNACGSRNSKTARGLSLPKSVSSRFARSKRIYLGGGKSTLHEREREAQKQGCSDKKGSVREERQLLAPYVSHQHLSEPSTLNCLCLSGFLFLNQAKLTVILKLVFILCIMSTCIYKATKQILHASYPNFEQEMLC